MTQPKKPAKESASSPQSPDSPVPPATSEEISFFNRGCEQRPEIIEGILREGQLAAFAGPYGVGKSPLLGSFVIHVLNGVPWCGRKVAAHPVIHIDFETPGPVYRKALKSIATHLGARLPKVHEELNVYLELDDTMERGTKQLLNVLKSKKVEDRLNLISDALYQKPNALVLIDPLELLLPIDTGKKAHILWAYGQLRQFLSQFPSAAIVNTFNLRKEDVRAAKADLLTNPRGWLNEVCGTLDILNRSDVRLGIDFYDDETRVVNGIRRSEDMHPLLVRPVADSSSDELAGFELCRPSELALSRTLTLQQLQHWQKLPTVFRFDEVADKIVPRSSLSRLLARAKSLGIAQHEDGIWKKCEIAGTSGTWSQK